MDWERYNRNKAARLARKENINKATNLMKWSNEVKKAKKPRKKLYGGMLSDQVQTIHWVKDTPRSRAIAFLEWRDAKQR